MAERKEWFSVQELMGLPGMPKTARGVHLRVERGNFEFRKKLFGKGREYSLKSLPRETQAHLQAQAIADVLTTPEARAFDGSTKAGTEQERAVTMVLRKLAEIEAAGARSVKAACHALIHSARAGLLPPMLVDALRTARDKRGRPSPDGLPSTRALELWVLSAKRGESLTPKKRQPQPRNPAESNPSFVGEHARNEEAPATVQDLAAWAQQQQAQALNGMQTSTGDAFAQHCDDFAYFSNALNLVARFERHRQQARTPSTQTR